MKQARFYMYGAVFNGGLERMLDTCEGVFVTVVRTFEDTWGYSLETDDAALVQRLVNSTVGWHVIENGCTTTRFHEAKMAAL